MGKKMIDRQEIVDAVSQAYCTPKNESKQLDSVLCTAIIDNVMKVINLDNPILLPEDNDEGT